jgi:hypothetical protein
LHRDELLQHPSMVDAEGPDDWWRLVSGGQEIGADIAEHAR